MVVGIKLVKLRYVNKVKFVEELISVCCIPLFVDNFLKLLVTFFARDSFCIILCGKSFFFS